MTYVQLAGGLHLLLLHGDGAEAPSSRVQVALHDDTLDLGDNTVIAAAEVGSGHQGDAQSDSLTLGGDDNNLIELLDSGLCRSVSEVTTSR